MVEKNNGIVMYYDNYKVESDGMVCGKAYLDFVQKRRRKLYVNVDIWNVGKFKVTLSLAEMTRLIRKIEEIKKIDKSHIRKIKRRVIEFE